MAGIFGEINITYRILITIVVLSSIFSLFPLSSSARNYSDYRITKITIIRENVFDPTKKEEKGPIGLWANRIHTITKEKVVRQELLFKEGDRYDRNLLEESERNLRKLDFLTNITIAAYADHQTREVEVVVSTRDQWTLILGGTVGGTSENLGFGFDFGDKNLLGLGQNLRYNLRHNNSGFSHSVDYEDKTWFDTRYTFNAISKRDPDEVQNKVLVEKPFYSLGTQRAHGASFLARDHDEEELRFHSRRWTLYYGWGFSFFKEHIMRTRIILSLGEQKIEKATNPKEAVADNKILMESEFLFQPNHYAKDTYIEKFRQKEDIFLGTKTLLSLGPAFEKTDIESADAAAQLFFSKNFETRKNDYFFTSFKASRRDEEFNNFSAEGQLRYYLRDFSRQTFLFHTKLSHLESETELFSLGGTEGLRGYKKDEFQGKSRILFNIEQRIYTYKSYLWGLIEPGFVLFIDTGETWNEKAGETLNGLRGSFGGGIRLALLKAPGISLVRIDLGQPMGLDRSPILTIGMEGFF